MLRRIPSRTQGSRLIKLLTSGIDLLLGEELCGEFELHRDSDEALGERVADLASDAIAFCKDGVEL